MCVYEGMRKRGLDGEGKRVDRDVCVDVLTGRPSASSSSALVAVPLALPAAAASFSSGSAAGACWLLLLEAACCCWFSCSSSSSSSLVCSFAMVMLCDGVNGVVKRGVRGQVSVKNKERERTSKSLSDRPFREAFPFPFHLFLLVSDEAKESTLLPLPPLFARL